MDNSSELSNKIEMLEAEQSALQQTVQELMSANINLKAALTMASKKVMYFNNIAEQRLKELESIKAIDAPAV